MTHQNKHKMLHNTDFMKNEIKFPIKDLIKKFSDKNLECLYCVHVVTMKSDRSKMFRSFFEKSPASTKKLKVFK